MSSPWIKHTECAAKSAADAAERARKRALDLTRPQMMLPTLAAPWTMPRSSATVVDGGNEIGGAARTIEGLGRESTPSGSL
jgi:hypothetical protein